MQSWLPQLAVMSPPSPLSRPGSSSDPACQFSNSQDTVGQIPLVTVASKPKAKLQASRADLPERTRQRNSILVALEKIAQSIAPASEAISEEAAALRRTSKRTKEYKERALQLGICKDEFQNMVKAPKWKPEERSPFDQREWEKRNTSGEGHAHSCAAPAALNLAQETSTSSAARRVSTRGKALLGGEETFRKNAPVTAGIHWKNLRRWLGIMKLAPSRDHPLSIREMLTEDEEKNMCEHLEMVRNARGRKHIPATHMNSRMSSSVGCVFLDSGDVAR